MAITLYIGSGSNVSWRAWLAIEHKQLAYELKILSFDKKETLTPEFTKLNPRQRLPVLIDDGFVLSEAQAIAEYLEDKYPTAGYGPLLPQNIERRALARRFIQEIDYYHPPLISVLVSQLLFKDPEKRDFDLIDITRDKFISELHYYAKLIEGPFFMGEKTIVDYALYPVIALILRFEKSYDLKISKVLPKEIAKWMAEIEQLPFYQKTYPPHWK